MFFIEFLFALLIALVIVGIFAFALGRPGPWGLLWFFVLVLLAAWAIALWTEPVGPAIAGVAWLPILLGALVFALLIAAIPPIERTPPASGEEVEAATAAGALGVFFWALTLLLLLVIALAYVF